MDYLNKNIAMNLKRIRLGKSMSLDEASEQTGVSKSMLAQIERGEGNPSIGSLGKIVSGLRVEINELLDEPRMETYYMPREKLMPTKEVIGQYTIYTYFPYEKNRYFEIYAMVIYPGGCYYSGAHGPDTMEYLIISKGNLKLKIKEVTYELKEGDAFRFNSDREHWYYNDGLSVLNITCFFLFK